MGSQVTVVYTTSAVGLTAAVLAARVAAVPLDPETLSLLGVRVTADATPAATPVVRTAVLSFLPATPATGTVAVKESRIISAAVTAPGTFYVQPPALSVTDVNRVVDPTPDTRLVRAQKQDAVLQAFLKLISIPLTAGGAGFVAPTLTLLGGLPPAERGSTGPMAVRYINLVNGGIGYPVGTTVDIAGGGETIQAKATLTRSALSGAITGVTITDMGSGFIKQPEVFFRIPKGTVLPANFKPATAFAVMADGTPARITVVVAAGVIAALTVANAGDGYVGVPTVLFTPVGGGGGATFGAPSMGLGRIDVTTPGLGYTATSVLVVTPYFKSFFPDVATDPQAQAAPFFRLFEESIAVQAQTPVFSSTPVVA